MAKLSDADPSPLRTGLIHAGLSLAVFGGLACALAAGIHFAGDPGAAGPHRMIALFDPSGDQTAALKTRIDDQDLQIAGLPEIDLQPIHDDGAPSLGIPDPGETSIARSDQLDRVSGRAADGGVVINGKIVLPGQSLSQVVEVTPSSGDRADSDQAGAQLNPFSDILPAGLYETAGYGPIPVIADDGRRVMDTYARPFTNTAGKPTVSIIIRGLGTERSRRYTNAAIEELPAEVTLSFVANAKGLSGLVERAHATGHEVLLEVPMEPYDDGRRAPLPHRLNSGQTLQEVTSRLDWQLARTRGYFGIMNNLGSKFAIDEAVARPFMAALARRGIAFIEDGNLPNSVLAEMADQVGASYVKANLVIDTRMDAAEIETQLLTLESSALETGHALGTGMTYPVTIDTVKAWAARLDAKGILLAPASYQFHMKSGETEARQAQLMGISQHHEYPVQPSGQDG